MDRKSNDILKRYKKKYTTKDRLDMSKGGRVKAAVGGPQKLKNITNYTPMPKAKVKPPVKAKPKPKPLKKAPVKKPIEKVTAQPGQPIPSGGGRGRMITGREELEKNNPSLRRDTIQPRMTNDLRKLIPGQPTATRRGAAPTTSEEKLKQVDSSGNIIKDTLMGRKQGETAEQYRARTAGQFTPSNTQQTYTSIEEAAAAKAGLTLEEYKASRPQTSNNIQTNDVARTAQTAQAFQQATVKELNMKQKKPVKSPEERRDPPISIGGVGGGQGGPGENEPTPTPTAAPTAAPTPAPTPAPTAAPSTSPEIERETETPVNVDEVTGEVTPYSTYQKDAALAAARKERIRETGLQTEAAARGEVPEGAKLKDAEQVGFQRDAQGNLLQDKDGNPIPLKDQVTTEMADTTKVTTEGAKPVTDETVSTGTVTEGTVAGQLEADTYEATIVDQSPEVKAALGELSEGAKAKVTEISKLTDPATFASISQKVAEGAKAKDIEGVLSSGAFVTEGGVRASDVNVSETPDAEKKEREAITGIPATDGKAAEILGVVSYDAVKQRAVTGQAAKGAAAEMIAEVGNMPPDIAAAIVEDPATVEAQVDTNPVEVNAAIAALPTEALVSSQMETLLGGMEDGKIPMWAKPAVDAMNAQMAQRGLSVSTVGRDALFNSIIQSAMPIAQSNAQALQTRAAQNLGNQQQANLQQATQEQQLRMQNLANRQDAASQTAQMSQQMKTMQSQFNQQAVMTTADQQQQMRLQNLQNQQQAAVTNVQNQQQMNMQNLGNEQQLNMAELQIDAARAGADQSAENQSRMAEMQVAADFLAKNAGFKQQMELANLSNDQQMRLANLSALNQASSENLSAEQQTELANLNKNMQTNLLQANIAKDMGLAQLNVDQQTAIYNATTTAGMNMANFNADQQRVLADSKFMQTVAITNMNAEQQSIMQNATAMASLDLATVDQRTKLAVTNAQNFLQMDMANLSNQQQSNMMKAQQEQQRLLSNQSAENASKQFNASSENQTNQFMANLNAQMSQYNASQNNAMEQFNASQNNAAEARRAGRDADLSKFDAQLTAQVDQFNSQQDFARNSWNAQNSAAVEASNVSWRRQANTINTAAQNQINAQNAQNAFGMSMQSQSFLWQELRDQADFDFRAGENELNRQAQILSTAIANEGKAGEKYDDYLTSLINTLGGSYRSGLTGGYTGGGSNSGNQRK